MPAELRNLLPVRPVAAAGLTGLVLALWGCGAQEVRTVTVQGGTPPPESSSTAARSDELSRQDNVRVATARVALHDYCAAKQSGAKANEDSEVAALVVLTTMVVRHPNATFSRSDESLALADVLKNEAAQLDSGRCDPKGAKLLRNAVDAAVYGGGR
ncbi:MAG TPA: hypothetical protein VHI73_05615 [Solirubrobacteraceae bacterium]|jgi:hypothetical protein|nr:hypothetical protein [Solirubrobacteraceae bacterium]